MNQSATQTAAERQIAEAMAAERESLRPQCRADAARLERLLAPDFHEFGTSGREIGYEGTAARWPKRRTRTANQSLWRTCAAGCLPRAS
jgi:hypothetical protein